MSWNPITKSQQIKEGSHIRTKINEVYHEYIIQSIGKTNHWCKLKNVKTGEISNNSKAKMIWDVYEVNEADS